MSEVLKKVHYSFRVPKLTISKIIENIFRTVTKEGQVQKKKVFREA